MNSPESLRERANGLLAYEALAGRKNNGKGVFLRIKELFAEANELEKQRMKISKITLRGILGIDNIEFSAGKFNIISGKNGKGKTSVLSGIRAVLKSGHDATLLKTGETDGEAVIVLSDGMQISKRITNTDSKTSITGSDGNAIKKPAETLKQLTDMLSVNPVDFLRANKKDRVSVLLESMPIKIDEEWLEELIGNAVPSATHPLLQLNAIETATYDERTGINRAIKEKHSTINQLVATLPDKEGEKTPMQEDGILNQIEAFSAIKDYELDRISIKLESMRKASDAKIEELQININAEKVKFQEFLGKANIQRQKTHDAYAKNTLELRENLATIKEQEKIAAKFEQTRETIVSMREQAEVLQKSADRQSEILDALKSYKTELLEKLPIPGLTVIDGDIYRNGVQFDRLNTAQQVSISVEIAKLRAGDLAICCCDGMEILDSDSFAEFQKQIMESGMQLFITRVSDDALTIESND